MKQLARVELLVIDWKDAEHEDQEDTRSVQASLLDEPLRPLKPQEFTFFNRYTSGGYQQKRDEISGFSEPEQLASPDRDSSMPCRCVRLQASG